jgi:tRNA pseudouridine55 synthase
MCAKSKNPNNLFATLNVIKPQGLTSHDVVSKLRKCYNLKRVGHLGTLDPLADGVLPICLGNATRLIEFFPSDKSYRAEITFGMTTSTLDAEGEPLTNVDASHLTRQDLEMILPVFTGEIQQKVPMHSAVHMNGKKLYEYAHEGIEVDTPTKTVTLYRLEVVDFIGEGNAHPKAILEMDCSSGTYVRAIARDMGQLLKVGAFLSSLTRTRHGRYKLEDAVELETLLESPTPQIYLQDPSIFLGLPHLDISDFEVKNNLCHGMKVPTHQLAEPEKIKLRGNDLCYVTFQGSPVAVVQTVSRTLKPLKVFAEPVAVTQTAGNDVLEYDILEVE